MEAKQYNYKQSPVAPSDTPATTTQVNQSTSVQTPSDPVAEPTAPATPPVQNKPEDSNSKPSETLIVSPDSTSLHEEINIGDPVVPTSSSHDDKPHYPMKWIAVVILIFFISATAYFWYQTQELKKIASQVEVAVMPSVTPVSEVDPTANWKTYSDESGYSFKYPPSYQISKIDSGVALRSTEALDADMDNEFDLDLLTLRNDNQLALKDFILKKEGVVNGKIPSSTEYEGRNYFRNIKTFEKKLVGGREAYFFNADPCSICRGETYITYIKLSPNTILAIDLFIDQDKEVAFAASYKIYDKILSTFKFIDQATDTTNWETYNNQVMGFSIKHPDTFKVTSSTIPNNGMQITFFSTQRTVLIIKKSNINPVTNEPYESLVQFDPRIKNFTMTKIGKIDAKDSGVYVTQGDTTQRDIVYQLGNSIWVIQDIQLTDKSNETFDGMLDTLVFQN